MTIIMTSIMSINIKCIHMYAYIYIYTYTFVLQEYNDITLIIYISR